MLAVNKCRLFLLQMCVSFILLRKRIWICQCKKLTTKLDWPVLVKVIFIQACNENRINPTIIWNFDPFQRPFSALSKLSQMAKICENHFRPSVKHVLGVQEWFYMVSKKITFCRKGFCLFSLKTNFFLTLFFLSLNQKLVCSSPITAYQEFTWKLHGIYHLQFTI